MTNGQIIEILEYWNFWGARPETGIARSGYADELYRQRRIKEVSVVSGVRRSGKSTILLQVLERLISGGVPEENTLYVNFEEPAFAPELNLEFLLQLHDAYLEKFAPRGKAYIVLDEVQLVPQWEKFVRGLYDRNRNIKFYVTGSSSKLLSREFGSALTGRTYANEVFPLSFAEFLGFGAKGGLTDQSLAGRGPWLRHQLLEYMRYGGFPQVALTKNKKDKLAILKGFYSAIIEKDIVQRFEVRDVRQLKEFYVNLVTNISSLFSAYRAEKKQDISQPTAAKFLEYAREVYLAETIDLFSYSYAKQKANPGKVYVVDPGIYSAISFRFSENLGKIFENLVYLEYRRRNQDVFYWKGKKEVDFLVRQGNKVKKAVNACWQLGPENRDRELASLLEAMDAFKLREAEIISLEHEETVRTGGKTVKIKNFFNEFVANQV
jgi:hypothetical protein